MQSTTTTITPKSTAEYGEFVNWLNAGTIISYKLGGKFEAGYEAYRTACMKEVIGITSTNRRARGTQGAATTVTDEAAPKRGRGRPAKSAGEAAPKRGRGRPAKSTGEAATKTPRTRTRAAAATENPNNEAILKCVAAGFSTQTAILPELKRNFGITIKANHLGIALSRLARAGKLAKTGDGKTAIWSPTAVGQQMAQAA
jgi:hypothetical protein